MNGILLDYDRGNLIFGHKEPIKQNQFENLIGDPDISFTGILPDTRSHYEKSILNHKENIKTFYEIILDKLETLFSEYVHNAACQPYAMEDNLFYDADKQIFWAWSNEKVDKHKDSIPKLLTSVSIANCLVCENSFCKESGVSERVNENLLITTN
jgi:hypothetical protein